MKARTLGSHSVLWKIFGALCPYDMLPLVEVALPAAGPHRYQPLVAEMMHESSAVDYPTLRLPSSMLGSMNTVDPTVLT
mgnify:CR=1 FL=1